MLVCGCVKQSDNGGHFTSWAKENALKPLESIKIFCQLMYIVSPCLTSKL